MMYKIPCVECDQCHGEGGHSDPEAIDQWYWCSNCDAGEKYYARKKKPIRTDFVPCWAKELSKEELDNLDFTVGIAIPEDSTEATERYNKLLGAHLNSGAFAMPSVTTHELVSQMVNNLREMIGNLTDEERLAMFTDVSEGRAYASAGMMNDVF